MLGSFRSVRVSEREFGRNERERERNFMRYKARDLNG